MSYGQAPGYVFRPPSLSPFLSLLLRRRQWLVCTETFMHGPPCTSPRTSARVLRQFRYESCPAVREMRWGPAF